ncbi:MAG: helix-turn-helix transcriptional regulator [Lachnospiraceae bacterium]|nr:helix-turn-helix transcriptional regulator [Lachnospiraceae bacterium]
MPPIQIGTLGAKIHSFKAEVGFTPHQFQLQNRIRKAQPLMYNAGTVTEVALTTGLCGQSHFIKQFEKLGYNFSVYGPPYCVIIAFASAGLVSLMLMGYCSRFS